MSISATLKQGTDLYFLYSFIRRLTTPFKDTQAYKLGIIDENGKVLRKRSSLRTADERAAYTLMDTMIFNMKKMLSKVPFGATRLASFAAALFLLKEKNNVKMLNDQEYLKEEFTKFYNEKNDSVSFIHESTATLNLFDQIEFIQEDAPVNATGTAVAGTGDDSSTVIIRRKKKKITDIKLEDKEVDKSPKSRGSSSDAFGKSYKKAYTSKNVDKDKLKASIQKHFSKGA